MAEEKETWEPDEEDALAKDLAEDDSSFSDLIEIIDPDEDSKDPEPKPEPEPEDDPASSRVQKRIDKLTAQRHEAERREAYKDQQIQELQDRLGNIESGQAEKAVETFQEKYEQVKKDLMEAAEEGDTVKQVALTEQMADMRATARVADMQRNQPQPQHQQQPTAAEAPQAAYDWWGRTPWFNTDEHAAESAYARAVDVQLAQEGYDKSSTEYYKELDNRLQQKFPELYQEHVSKRSKPPTSPSGGKKQTGNRAKDGRIQLTRAQLNMARELGITTEAELKAYAKEIQELS